MQQVRGPTRGQYILDLVLSNLGNLKIQTLPTITDHHAIPIDCPIKVPGVPHGWKDSFDLAKAGKNDVIVPSSISERLIQKLRQLGANESEAKLTLYDAAPPPKGWPDYDGHGSPMPAYATPELWRWLLEQHL